MNKIAIGVLLAAATPCASLLLPNPVTPSAEPQIAAPLPEALFSAMVNDSVVGGPFIVQGGGVDIFQDVSSTSPKEYYVSVQNLGDSTFQIAANGAGPSLTIPPKVGSTVLLSVNPGQIIKLLSSGGTRPLAVGVIRKAQ